MIRSPYAGANGICFSWLGENFKKQFLDGKKAKRQSGLREEREFDMGGHGGRISQRGVHGQYADMCKMYSNPIQN